MYFNLSKIQRMLVIKSDPFLLFFSVVKENHPWLFNNNSVHSLSLTLKYCFKNSPSLHTPSLAHEAIYCFIES